MASGPPAGIDLTANVGNQIVGVDLAMVTLATIAVALRLYSRTTGTLSLKWDDLMICISLILSWGLCIGSILAVHFGVGRHIWNPSVNVEKVVEMLFAYEFIYSSVVPSVKLSLILFYARLFPTRNFTRALYVCTFLVVGWWISVMITVIVQCRPYNYFWLQYTDPTAQGKCINTYAFFMAIAVTSVLTDFIILVCPIPLIWSLKMPVVQRLSVIGIFALGFFGCVAGLVRTITVSYIVRPDGDLTWNISQAFIWSTIEPCIGILCACLPILRPLFRRAFPKWFSRSSNDRSNGHPSNLSGALKSGDASHSLSKNNGFGRLGDGSRTGRMRSEGEIGLTNEVGTGMGRGERGYPMNAIAVKRDVEWTATAISDGDSK